MCRLRLRAWLSLEAEGDSVVNSEDQVEAEGEEDVEPEEGLEDTPDTLPEPFDWILCRAALPFSVHKLRWLCFDNDSPVVAEFGQRQKWGSMQVGKWVDGKRELTYMLPKTSFMKESPSYETQT